MPLGRSPRGEAHGGHEMYSTGSLMYEMNNRTADRERRLARTHRQDAPPRPSRVHLLSRLAVALHHPPKPAASTPRYA